MSSLAIINAGEGVGPHVTNLAIRHFMKDATARRSRTRRHPLSGFVVLSSAPPPSGISSQTSPEAAIAFAMGGQLGWWQHRPNASAQAALRAFELAHEGMVDAVITGPIRKSSFRQLGLRELGHNGVLREVFGYQPVQGYAGPELNLVLATDHLPLAEVPRALTSACIRRALVAATELRQGLDARKRRLPVAFLGLNPHAGEGGLMGRDELRLRKLIGRQFVGPIPADSAFTIRQRAKYSVVIALYHDQGLIPFKTLHGQNEGYQVSLGLPFIRTSVDHGTADDLIKTGNLRRIEAGSMIAAIRGAVSRMTM